MAKILLLSINGDQKFSTAARTALDADGHFVQVVTYRDIKSFDLPALQQYRGFQVLVAEIVHDPQSPDNINKAIELAARLKSIVSHLLTVAVTRNFPSFADLPRDLTVFARVVSGDLPTPDIISFVRLATNEHLQRTANERAESKISEAVELNLAGFVEEAIATQQDYERRHRRASKFWHFIGFISLASGFLIVSYLFYNIIISVRAEADYSRAVTLGFLTVAAIAILGALSRYAYSLGKAYMTESLKSSDRIHAIQFGKFFLRAYGGRASTAEIKEVFQHWNIDRTSAFASLDSSAIDPQIVNMAIQLVSAIRGSGSGSKPN